MVGSASIDKAIHSFPKQKTQKAAIAWLFDGPQNIALTISNILEDSENLKVLKGYAKQSWEDVNQPNGPIQDLWKNILPKTLEAILKQNKGRKNNSSVPDETDRTFASLIKEWEKKYPSNQNGIGGGSNPDLSLLKALQKYEGKLVRELKSVGNRNNMSFVRSWQSSPTIPWFSLGYLFLNVMKRPLLEPEFLFSKNSVLEQYLVTEKKRLVRGIPFPILGDFVISEAINRLALMIITIDELANRLGNNCPLEIPIKKFNKIRDGFLSTNNKASNNALSLIQIYLVGRPRNAQLNILPVKFDDIPPEAVDDLRKNILGSEMPNYLHNVLESLKWLKKRIAGSEKTNAKTRSEYITERNKDIWQWHKDGCPAGRIAELIEGKYNGNLEGCSLKMKPASIKRIIRGKKTQKS